MLKFFSFTRTEGQQIELSKCSDCGSYFLDRNKTGSCCKQEIIMPRMEPNKPGIIQFKFLRR